MDDRPKPVTDAPRACPFIAFDDDRDRRSDAPDHRHRCFAEASPATRAIAHQQAYCLSAAFPTCPIFLDWARREAAAVAPSGATGRAGVGAGPVAGLGDWSAPPPWAPDAASRAAPDGDDVAAPSFLTGRSRAGSDAQEVIPDRRPAASVGGPAAPVAPPVLDPDAGLFGPGPDRDRPWAAAPDEDDEDEDLGSGRGSPGVVPVPPAGRRATQVHPRSGHRAATDLEAPSWERPRRMEAYPTIRTRMGLPQVPPVVLAIAALVIAAAVLFFVAPGILFPKAAPASSHGTSAPSASVTASASVAPSSAAVPTPQIYVVKANDTFSGIASSHGLTLAQLTAANPQIKDPNKLSIGDRITIPQSTPTQITNASAVPSTLSSAP